MRFKFLTGDVNWRDYGGKWISPKQKNIDWPSWYVIQFINMDDAVGSDNKGKPKYHVEVHLVAPDAVSDEDVAAAMNSCGRDDVAWSDLSDEEKVLILSEYGITATLYQGDGNNARVLLKQARDHVNKMDMFLGFQLDKFCNRAGHTGWDFLRGDLSIDTAIKNRQEHGVDITPEVEILKKMEDACKPAEE